MNERARTLARPLSIVALLTMVLLFAGTGTVAGSQGSGDGSCVVTVADGDSIQDAIDDAAEGSTICVASGTYEESLSITTDDLTIVAADGATPVLNGSEGFGNGIHVNGASGVVVDGLTVQYFGGIGIYLQDAPDATVRNTVVTDNEGGIFGWNGDQATIEGNTLTNNTQGAVSGAFGNVRGGIHLSNVSSATIEGNVASGNHEANIHLRQSDDAVLRNNTVMDAPGGQQGSIYIYESANATIEGNVAIDNDADDLARGIFLRLSDRATVTDNNISENRGGGLHVRTSSNVSVSNNTIVSNDATGVATYSSEDALIEHNTIELNDGQGIRIQQHSHRAVVQHNDVFENADAGIWASDSLEVVIADNEFTGNGNAGIAVSGMSWADRDGTVERNMVVDNSGDGIRINGPSGMVVSDNDVGDNDENGIHAIDADDVVITRNTVTGHLVDGIRTDGAVNVTVASNTVTANAATGISIVDTVNDPRETTVYNNTVTSNVDGLLLSDFEINNVNVSSNRIEDNTNGITIADNPSTQDSVRVHWNLIQNNANRGVDHQHNQLINVTYNWWGHESGPSGGAVDRATGAVANGSGDSIEHDSHDDRFWFDPWLTSEGGDNSDEDTGTLSGTVTDTETTDPIEDATVFVLDGNSVLASTTADSNGQYAVAVATGTYDVSVDADGYESASVDDVEITDGDVTTLDVALTPESAGIVSSSLSHGGGSTPDLGDISVDAFVAADMLQIQLINDTADQSDLGNMYDLTGVGADHTTVFEINLTVDDYEPRLLLGAGDNVSWETTDNGDGTWNVSVIVQPVEMHAILDENGSTPDLGAWPTGANDTATVGYNATVQLAADDLSVLSAGVREQLAGTVLATDAQAFGTPQYDPVAEKLSLTIAGPHFTTDGAQNEGFYDALLPAALLEAWGLTSPGQLTAAYQGAPADFDAEWVDGNAQEDVRISIDLHYSAGVVAISASTDGGDDGGSSDPGDSGGIDPGSSGDDEPTATVPTPTETTTTTTSSPATTSPTPADTPTASGDDTQTEPDDDSSTQQTTPSTQAPATTSTPGQPGFGLLVTVLALLAAFLIARRRR